MRVLVTATPGTGHVFPMLPLAAALRRAGHDLLWAIAEDGVEEVRRHGYAVAVAGMNLDERRASLESRLPQIMSDPPRARRGQLFSGLFARGAAPKMIRELVPVLDSFRPELVIHEMAELGAAPHAVARGIPHATVAFSGGLPSAAITAVEDALIPIWASLGLSAPSMSDVAGDVYFHPFPASMGQNSNIAQVRLMRPAELEERNVLVPSWVASFGRERRGVYVTAGTTPIVATLAPWRAIFASLKRIDVDALATIGPKLPIEDLGPLPSNVRVERYVPQSMILDRLSVLVSHAGAGTLLAAARQGIPQLLIPTWADQWENSDAIARTGAGILLEENERDAETIHAAVQKLLNDESYRVSADRLAQEIAEMPSPSDHVATLETLLSARRTVT